MGSIRKKTATKPVPNGAELFTRSGIRFARWKTAAGKSKTAKLTIGNDGVEKIVVESGVWLGKFRNADGHIIEQSTGCRDKQAAAAIVAQWERRVELVKCGVVSKTEDRIADHQQTPLVEHFAAYLLHLEGAGTSPLHRRNVKAHLARLQTECGLTWLSDITAEGLTKWMLSASKVGLGARTRNLHRSALVAFCGWCVESSRLVTNPLTTVALANERADRRHVRRALSEDEIARLLDAAERRPLLEAQTVRQGSRKGLVAANVRPEVVAELQLQGRERRLIYATLLSTGLRKSELGSITIGQAHLDGDAPFLDLAAADEKNRQGTCIPLRGDMAAELRNWIADLKRAHRPTTFALGRSDEAEEFPHRPLFRVPAALDKIIAKDFKLAGIPRKDASGRVVDVHALRVTFSTMLSKAGVAPRTAQAAMRHSDLRLTMQTYTDASLLDVHGAVESLPELPLTATTVDEPQALRATGTFGDQFGATVTSEVQQHSFRLVGETLAETSALNSESALICSDSKGEPAASQALGEGPIPFTRSLRFEL